MTWSTERERGGVAWLAIMLWIVRHAGWQAGRALLWPITAFYYATSPNERAASRDYLGRVLGRPARRRDVFRHIYVFASAIMDRVFLIAGATGAFSVETHGVEQLDAIVAQGNGCVLLGAHVGSFEALRMIARASPVPVRPLMYRTNAGALTRLLERLDPSVARDIIEIGGATSMLRVHESVARGEIVGILADRSPGGPQRQVTASFLDAPAAFPAGPFVLAASLGAPVVLFSAVRTGARRYVIRFEPFADRIVLARATRDADLAACVARFATHLEALCRAHPFNWFNFFPFWEQPDDAEPAPRRAAARLPATGSRPGASADPVAG